MVCESICEHVQNCAKLCNVEEDWVYIHKRRVKRKKKGRAHMTYTHTCTHPFPHTAALAPPPPSTAPTTTAPPPRRTAPGTTTRCGVCHTCRNKQLKKACMRNKALKLTGTAMYEAVVAAIQGGVPPQMLPMIPESYHDKYVFCGGVLSVLGGWGGWVHVQVWWHMCTVKCLCTCGVVCMVCIYGVHGTYIQFIQQHCQKTQPHHQVASSCPGTARHRVHGSLSPNATHA